MEPAAHHFLAAVFARSRFRRAAGTDRMSDLMAFHTRHKLLLMAMDEARYRRMGPLLGQAGRDGIPDVMSEYRALLHEALARRPTPGGMTNALQHAFGYLSDEMAPQRRAGFLARLDAYREGALPLWMLTDELLSRARAQGQAYLMKQWVLRPYPKGLRRRIMGE